jgi:hypothetical protein
VADQSVAERVKGGADFLAVGTGLATGAVIFATGLLVAPLALPLALRWLLVGAIICLVGAMLCILVAKVAIVWRVSQNFGSIDDLRLPVLIMFALLAAGCIAVTFALVQAMVLVPDVQGYKTQSAQAAIRVAMQQIAKKPCHLVDRLPTVELIKGLESSTAQDATWHVHVDLRQQPVRQKRPDATCAASYDVYIDAKDDFGVLY